MAYKDNITQYGFGQLGSTLVDGTTSFFPPINMVIIAITALDDVKFNSSAGLVSELNEDNNAGISVGKYLTTEGAGGHVDGEIKDADPHNGGNSTGLGGVTGKVETAANMLTAGVKVGMYVHTGAGSMLAYSADDPFIVKSKASDHFIVTKGHHSNPAVGHKDAKANGSNEPCYFVSSMGQGVGGNEMDASNIIPKGVTIYGRWTRMKLSSGAAIVYFGV